MLFIYTAVTQVSEVGSSPRELEDDGEPSGKMQRRRIMVEDRKEEQRGEDRWRGYKPETVQ